LRIDSPTSRRAGAFRTTTINRHVMSRGAEPSRQPGLDFAGAPFEFEDATAVLANKMVVVLLTGPFVQRCATRHLDGGKPSFVDEGADGAVNRRHADSLDRRLCLRKNLFDRKGTSCTLKGLPDRTPLARISFGHNSNHGAHFAHFKGAPSVPNTIPRRQGTPCRIWRLAAGCSTGDIMREVFAGRTSEPLASTRDETPSRIYRRA
jgi:hypothetical protein